ncbi:hypothetical protein D9M69_642030 [compost metagenome]
MAFGSVARHVEHGVAVVDEGVEVGQGAGHGAPERGLPHGGVAAHHGHAHGRTERNLGQ